MYMSSNDPETQDEASSDAREFYVAGGTLSPSATSYVERSADRELLAALLRAEYCYVLNTRQIGKSSLIVRAAAKLREANLRVCLLDLSAIGVNVSLDQWYFGLLIRLASSLGRRREALAFWEESGNLGPMQRWIEAIRQVLLPASEAPLVIFIDEIDTVRSLLFSADEFFIGIRECYNRRGVEPEMNRLCFCLVGVAAPAELIADVRLSPFNIGRRIELTDFTLDEIAPLAQGLPQQRAETGARKADSPPEKSSSSIIGKLKRRLRPDRYAISPSAMLRRVFHWTGGHPYLTQRFCAEIASREAGKAQPWSHDDIDCLADALFITPRARETDDNLVFVRNRMLKSDLDRVALLDVYRRVRRGRLAPADETNAIHTTLRLAGIVRVAEGRLQVRNRLYARVFSEEWILEQMPNAELRRQRAAYRAGLLRATAAGSLVTLALSVLAASSYRNAQQARMHERRANANARESKRKAYQLTLALKEAQAQKSLADAARLEADRAAQREKLARLAADRARLNEARSQRAAERSAVEARKHAANVSRYLYAADTNLIQREWEQGNVFRVQPLLDEIRDQGSGKFEWAFWQSCLQRMETALTTRSPLNWAVRPMPGTRDSVSCSEDRSVTWWDGASLRARRIYTGADSGLICLCVSPNGRRIAARSRTGGIYLWDRAMPLPRLRIATLPKLGDIVFSRNGRDLIVGCADGWLRYLDAATGRQRRQVRVWPEGQIRASAAPIFAMSPDESRAIVGGLGEVARVVDVRTGALCATLRGHDETIFCVAFSPDGRTVATGSHDAVVKLWDAATGTPLRTLTGHANYITCIQFTPDGRQLYSLSADLTMRLWDVNSGREERVFRGHSSVVTGVLQQTIAGRARLVTAGHDGTLRVWPLKPPPDLREWRGSRVTVPEPMAALSPDGRRLAIIGDRGAQKEIRLYSLPGQKPPLVQPISGALTGGVVFSPDGKLLALPALRATILLDARSGRKRATLATPGKRGDWVYGAAFSPDGSLLATGDWDGQVRLWDLRTLTLRQTLAGFRHRVSMVRFSPDGSLLAACSYDGSVRLWNLASPGRGRVIHTGNHVVWDVAFSPDGRMLATASEDRTARIWDVASGRERQRFSGHAYFVYSVAFSRDGSRLLTAGDRTVRIWDIATGHELLTLSGFSSFAGTASFSQDGAQLLATGLDGAVKLWESRAD
jgi:WD40 repeat protein